MCAGRSPTPLGGGFGPRRDSARFHGKDRNLTGSAIFFFSSHTKLNPACLTLNEISYDAGGWLTLPDTAATDVSGKSKSWRDWCRTEFPSFLYDRSTFRSGAVFTSFSHCSSPLTGRCFQDGTRTFSQPTKAEDPRVDFFTIYKRIGYIKEYGEYPPK